MQLNVLDFIWNRTNSHYFGVVLLFYANSKKILKVNHLEIKKEKEKRVEIDSVG